MIESTDNSKRPLKSMGLQEQQPAMAMNDIEVLQLKNRELQNMVVDLERELLDLYRRVHVYDRPSPAY